MNTKSQLTTTTILRYRSEDIKTSPFTFTVWWTHIVVNKTAAKELGQRKMTGFRLSWRIEEEDGAEVEIIPEKKYTEKNFDLVKMVNLVHEAGKQGVTMEKVWSIVEYYSVYSGGIGGVHRRLNIDINGEVINGITPDDLLSGFQMFCYLKHYQEETNRLAGFYSFLINGFGPNSFSPRTLLQATMNLSLIHI